MADPGERPREAAGRTHASRDVRQGEIILRQRWQRLVFVAGLVGFALLAILGGIWVAG